MSINCFIKWKVHINCMKIYMIKLTENRLKSFRFKRFNESHGDRFATPRPLNKKERLKREERKKLLPKFRYHPDPLETGSFIEGEAKNMSLLR